MFLTKYLYSQLHSATEKLVKLLVTANELDFIASTGVNIKFNSMQKSKDEKPENFCYSVTVNRLELLNALDSRGRRSA